MYQPKFALQWTDLSFCIEEQKLFGNGPKKKILQKQSGCVRAGEVLALVGPSGAGKSSLLLSLASRQSKGVTGDIGIQFWTEKRSPLIALVPQKDALFAPFNAFETLLFASRMKNSDPNIDHEQHVTQTLTDFNLDKVSKTKVAKLSGGQKKRLAIAIEIISKPDILILDEPTSGLDSVAAANCVGLLRELATRYSLAIVCSIHQPNNEVFCMFSSLYVLSSKGQNIYQGPPNQFLPFCLEHGLKCNTRRSLSEFCVDVARGKYGIQTVRKMAWRNVDEEGNNNENRGDLLRISDVNKFENRRSVSWTKQMTLFFQRSVQYSCYKTPALLGRISFGLFLACLLAFMFEEPLGHETGCADLELLDTGSGSAVNNEFRMRFVHKINRVISSVALYNLGITLFAVMVTQFVTGLVFPKEFIVLKNELSNNWYSKSASFIGRTLADLISLAFTLIIPYLCCHFFTDQPDLWRIGPYMLSFFLIGLIGEVFGMIFALVLVESSDNLLLAAQLNAGSIWPSFFFSGFFVKYAELYPLFKPLSWTSYVRFGFENLLLSTYGFGRCPMVTSDVPDLFTVLTELNSPVKPLAGLFKGLQNSTQITSLLSVEDELVDEVLQGASNFFIQMADGPGSTGELTSSSIVLRQYGLYDELYYRNIIIMILYYFVIKLICYLLYCKRAKN